MSARLAFVGTPDHKPRLSRLAIVVGARAFVVEAKLALEEGCDPAAVGAVVTVELCGDLEHDGPCRWPHNSTIDARRDPALFRALFVAEEAEAEALQDRIEAVLKGASEWRVVSIGSRAVAQAESALAERLLTGPRLAG